METRTSKMNPQQPVWNGSKVVGTVGRNAWRKASELAGGSVQLGKIEVDGKSVWAWKKVQNAWAVR